MAIFDFDRFQLDTALYELRRDGEPVALEPQVFTVLAYLVEHRDRVVTKNELIDHVWPERFISEAALTSRLMAARRAIGDSGQEQRYIRTLHGRGYRFVADVHVAGVPVEERRASGGEGPRIATVNGASRSVTTPDIRYCKTTDGVRIAYATSGAGPPLVKVANWLSHLEFDWRSPVWRHWIEELSRHHTYVRYDERGCGLSERDVDEFSVEAWVRDLEAVVDALGLDRFPLLGISQGGPVAMTYAVRHPERVSRLVLYGTYVQGRRLRGRTREEQEEQEALATLMRLRWGRDDPSFRAMFANEFIPGANEEQKRWFNDLCRISASAESAMRFYRAFGAVDASGLLSQVSVPTLVLHATDDKRVPLDQAQKLAADIPGARFVALDGRNHILLEDEPAWPRFVAEVRRFLGVPHGAWTDQGGVHTILFVAVGGSAASTRQTGDRAGSESMRQLESEIRALVSLHGGGDFKGPDDGIVASFKAPARALECAVAIQRAAEALAEARGTTPRLRIGLHAGEPLVEGDDLSGGALSVASQLTARATGGDVFVSDVVRQLSAGRGFHFEDRGPAVLKGYDDPIHVFALRWQE
jgi:pimeloyl-ACP methyl ester carboxylesterase/DNA-binding winged helix-turn-helix (wHTH) protein